MSYRAPKENGSFFFRISHDVPLVVAGRPVQDLDIESRVNAALLAEFEGNNSSWKPKPLANDTWWREWRVSWWRSMRCYLGVLLTHIAAFSLGSVLGARHE